MIAAALKTMMALLAPAAGMGNEAGLLQAAAGKAMTLLPAATGITKGAAKMARTDPHGWTLTLVSVSVVFSGLVILYFIYSLSGAIFSGKFKRSHKTAAAHDSRKGGVPTEEEMAAIALALQAENGMSDEEIAAALAVSLYLGTGVHDPEPGYLTFAPTGRAWADKTLTFRRRPQK